MQPKVFISYSWSDQEHQDIVKNWAERLISDGIEVILDIYDLKEGNDKYAFMELMVTEESVTHVLVICDELYMEKANKRKSGVGTESMIISQEVYEKVNQSKFIPIIAEFTEDNTPCLPIFLNSRIWIDFSTPEKENENWERLIRLLYGKPQHIKPKLGKAPSFITNEVILPTTEASAKFNTLKQALINNKPGIELHRNDFFNSCLSYADELRVRSTPNGNMGEGVLDIYKKLKNIRNILVDWLYIESKITPEDEFTDVVIGILEKIRILKTRPKEVTSWNESWFESHSLFVYEIFLYFISVLIKNKCFKILNSLFKTHYITTETELHDHGDFVRFNDFYTYSQTLQSVLAPDGRRLYSPAAELLKQNADRSDLPFSKIIEAELLTLLMSAITPNSYWYPQTLHYSSHSSRHLLFIRATQHKYFINIATITGINDVNELKSKIEEGFKLLEVDKWRNFSFNKNFYKQMNLDNWDTLD